ncbi:MAG TPA: carboxypeptidase-like regulatory domain-containing protein [Smithellaceae bacterium]|nr:carboxypeptidase-like regulatory domain-containing protein [Smithellaceae bacterium]
MKKLIIAMLVMVGIMFSTTLFAAELHGIVTDKSGKPVAIKMDLTNAKDGKLAASVKSDNKGSYLFKDIKLGSYLMIIDAKKFKVQVAPGDTRKDFQLEK